MAQLPAPVICDPELRRLVEDRDRLVQVVAEICGEFSLDAAGTFFRVYFPKSLAAFAGEDDAIQEIIDVQPERAEGIYESIALRLMARLECQPLQAARREAAAANARYSGWFGYAGRLRKALEFRVLDMVGGAVHCTLCDAAAASGWAIDIEHGQACPLRPPR